MLPSMKRSYSTDLSDAEWGCLSPHVPPPYKRGRSKTHSTREVLNAVFYVLKSVPLAATAQGRPALGDRLPVVREMAHRRDLRAPQRRPARAAAETVGQGPAA
jgi:transposase